MTAASCNHTPWQEGTEGVRIGTYTPCDDCTALAIDHPECPINLSGIDGATVLRVMCDGRHVKL